SLPSLPYQGKSQRPGKVHLPEVPCHYWRTTSHFQNDPYHPDHFNCANCRKELPADAHELKGELCCLPCHDKMGVPICGARRRPI
ncbi:hypothetical protein CIB84_008054, partial [Bambusicola thoracicus]